MLYICVCVCDIQAFCSDIRSWDLVTNVLVWVLLKQSRRWGWYVGDVFKNEQGKKKNQDKCVLLSWPLQGVSDCSRLRTFWQALLDALRTCLLRYRRGKHISVSLWPLLSSVAPTSMNSPVFWVEHASVCGDSCRSLLLYNQRSPEAKVRGVGTRLQVLSKTLTSYLVLS